MRRQASTFLQVPYLRRTPSKIAPRELEAIPLGRSIMFPQQHDSPFGGYIESCGHEERNGVYMWDGLTRKQPSAIAVFQYTLAGEGCLRFGTKQHRLTPGTAMLLFIPHKHRYWLPLQQSTWRFLFVSLTGSHIVDIWKWLVAKTGPVANLDPNSRPIVLLGEICRRAARGDLDDEYQAADFAHQLVFSLCEKLLPEVRGNEVPAALRFAEEFCANKLHCALGVRDIAAAANITTNTLTKLLRQHRDTTPREFLERLRMERACFLLAATDLPMVEVARRCGFRDGNYFAKVFRRIFALSPSDYRAQRS